MARGIPVRFDMNYKVEFTAPIRGHHIYKDTWCPKMGEELVCHKDDREEAKQYDLNAIGVFQSACDEKSERLVGHIPVEISQLINYFISAANTNTIIAVATGKRKREIGLVVPAKYFAYTNNTKNAEKLMKKLLEKKIFSNSLYTTKILLKDLVYFNL